MLLRAVDGKYAMDASTVLHLLSFILFLLSVLHIASICLHLRKSTAGIPPGSCGFPLIGETLAFVAANNSSRGFYDFVRIRRERYGNCFKTNIFGRTHVFISSTEAAKVVLSSDFVDFKKRYIRSIAELVGDQSLLCTSQENHKRIRSSLSGLFTMESMSSFIERFDEMVTSALNEWKGKKRVVVLNDTMKISFIAICEMLLGLKDLGELEIFQNDVSEVCDAMLALPLKLPWTRFYKGLKARKRIMERLEKIITVRRRVLEHHEDFLQSLLMKDESSSNGPLTDEQIQDNILTLIIAGQVTTATVMTWMVKYLDENQGVQETLRAVQLSLANKAGGQSLRLEDLNEMSYASKVVKESLRLASVVSWFPRVALKDCWIQGYRIREGWIVNVDARSIHMDPTVYDDPTKFCPSRFDEDSKPYSFLAFGTGGRTCLGMNLGKAMMLVFLHRLVTTHGWEVVDADSSLEKWALFPRLKSGCPVHVTPLRQEDDRS